MKNIGLGQQTGFKSGSHDADTHIDILPKMQPGIPKSVGNAAI
jgi:hypothetical protein